MSDSLDAALRSFPGLAKADGQGAGSHVHGGQEDDRVLITLGFENNGAGKTARLVVDFIMSHMGNGSRLDSRAPVYPDAALACSCAPPDAVFYSCSAQQVANFARALLYASPRPQGPARPATRLAAPPLSVLLSHAFAAFEEDYASAATADLARPSLGLWSNVLRGIGKDGLATRDLPRRTILSRRTTRAVLRDLARLDWLAVDRGQRGGYLRLTAAGRRVRSAGAALVCDVEHAWLQRFGTRRIQALRDALAGLVDQLDIELPWCLTGYGLADASVTGGSHIAGKIGPPRIPAHGEDWPVVLREPGSNAARMPLSALIAQALAAFTIDYEWDIFGYGAGLNATSNLLRRIGDGMPLAQAAALGEVSGNGKAGLERHLVVVVEPGKPRDTSRRVYLTPKGKRARDSHESLLTDVERDWRTRHGDCVAALRTALEDLDRDLGADLPDYPSPTAWIRHSMIVASAVARRRLGAVS